MGDGNEEEGGALVARKREAAMPEPEPRKGDLLPAVDPTGDLLDAGALFSSAIPVLGGAISSVLSGWSQERKWQRVREVLEQLDRELRNTKTSIREDYVRSDEFEDLLDHTLRRVATERHEAKRRLYAAFLAGAITSPGEPYHEQLRFLRTLEELQPDHMRIIHAMLQEPSGEAARGLSGTISQSLQRRLSNMPQERIADLYGQLTDELKLVVGGGFNTMMTAHGAEDLRNRFTRYGERLVAYIRAAEKEGRT